MGERNTRLAFGLLIAAGWLGAHRLYLHRYASGVAQLLLSALMIALWIWGGSLSRFAPYLLAPILFWLLHDGFWLFDYFRVEVEMDTSLAGFVDSDPAPLPKASRKADVLGGTRPQSLVDAASEVEDAEIRKKARAIKLAKQQIAESLQDNHPQAAHIAAERLVKYLQLRSRRPQNDPHLAEAYLLQGMVLYQTQYAYAARKKLQMGVHLASSFAHLSVQVQQAQSWLDKLRNPQLVAQPGAVAQQVQPGQYEALMQAGDWVQAAPLCAQTIAMRQSAKTQDVADLAQHYLNAMEIAQKLGQLQDARTHGQQLLELIAHKNSEGATQSLVPSALQRQAQERMGDLAYSANEHSAASQHYREALALAAAHQASPVQICGLLQRLALSFERAGDNDKALECWASAAAHITKLGDVVEDSESVSDVLTRYAAFSVHHQPAQVKPLIEQSLRIQQRSYRGYSLAAARAYEVFASFMLELDKPQARIQYLRQALMLYQVCEPDNSAHIAQLKKTIAKAELAQAVNPLAEQVTPTAARAGGEA